MRDPFEFWLFLCEKEVCFQAKVDRSKFEHVLLIKMEATGLFGRVGEFRPERETFRSYVERMDMFFMANNIVEEQGEGNEEANLAVQKKRAIFQIEIVPKAYSTLSNLLAPAKPRDTPFAVIVEALEKDYNPAPLEIAESFHFGTRYQKRDESIGDFIVALKKLSIHCNYGELLNRDMRDRFVFGLNNSKIQNKLSNTEGLTFEKACQRASPWKWQRKTPVAYLNPKQCRSQISSSLSFFIVVDRPIQRSTSGILSLYLCDLK